MSGLPSAWTPYQDITREFQRTLKKIHQEIDELKKTLMQFVCESEGAYDDWQGNPQQHWTKPNNRSPNTAVIWSITLIKFKLCRNWNHQTTLSLSSSVIVMASLTETKNILLNSFCFSDRCYGSITIESKY